MFLAWRDERDTWESWPVDNPNIRGLQSRRNAHLFELGHQAVIESLRSFRLALEDVVLDHALGHGIRFAFAYRELARALLRAARLRGNRVRYGLGCQRFPSGLTRPFPSIGPEVAGPWET